MGTTYYPPQYPITDIEINENTLEICLTIDNKEKTRMVFPSKGALELTLPIFFDFDYCTPDGFCGVMHTHWGGSERKIVVDRGHELPPEMLVISEYEEITAVAKVLAKQGTGKLSIG